MFETYKQALVDMFSNEVNKDVEEVQKKNLGKKIKQFTLIAFAQSFGSF